MYVCMHVRMVVIPYYVLIQNYMKTFSKCKQAPTHRHTNATFTVSTCSSILAVRILLWRYEEKHREQWDRKMAEERDY